MRNAVLRGPDLREAGRWSRDATAVTGLLVLLRLVATVINILRTAEGGQTLRRRSERPPRTVRYANTLLTLPLTGGRGLAQMTRPATRADHPRGKAANDSRLDVDLRHLWRPTVQDARSGVFQLLLRTDGSGRGVRSADDRARLFVVRKAVVQVQQRCGRDRDVAA